MSTLTHERTDLFIGGVATVERPGTHPDHLPSHRGTVRRRPDWHLHRRRPCDRRGPAVADLARSLRVGDPLAPTARVGPLVTQQQRERVEGFITAGRAEGARVVAGGGRPKDLDRGWYIEPPSLLTWPRTPPRSGRRSSGPCSLSSRTTTSTTR